MSDESTRTHPSFYPASATALLLMDFQVAVMGIISAAGIDVPALLARTAALATACRQQGIPVIHVLFSLRPDSADISPSSKGLSPLKGKGFMLDGSEQAAVHPTLTPQPKDIVLSRRRVGSFYCSELSVILSAMGTKSLILAGVQNSGVVLSTVREAADLDYAITVARDCCADRKAHVEKVLMEDVIPMQAHVMKSDELLPLIKSLSA